MITYLLNLEVVDRLGLTLVHFLWQGALLALLVAVSRSGPARLWLARVLSAMIGVFVVQAQDAQTVTKRYATVCMRRLPENVSLQDAVAEFNRKAMQDEVGKTQPPLTVEEIIANIRAMTPERNPMSQEALDAFLSIEKTRTLPHGTELSFCSGWVWKDRKFKVWWVDIHVNVSEEGSYKAYRKWGGIRLRDLKLECVMVEANDTQKGESSLSREAKDDKKRWDELKAIEKSRPDARWTEQEWLEASALMERMMKAN